MYVFQELDIKAGNMTEILSSVDKRVQVMRQFQQLSRGLESRDYNLLVANGNYVSTWSLIQCVVIILCGLTQVYSLSQNYPDISHSNPQNVEVLFMRLWHQGAFPGYGTVKQTELPFKNGSF